MFLSEWREFSFGALLCRKKVILHDSQRLVVIEMARVG